MPEREDDHLTPATRLLEKRREMAEVEQALAAQKEVTINFVKSYVFILKHLTADIISAIPAKNAQLS